MWRMLRTVDEAQLEVSRSEFKYKKFNSEEDAIEWTQVQDKAWSEPFEVNGQVAVGYTRAAELISMAVDRTTKHFNLNVPLHAGYIIGRNWKECH